MRARDRLRDLFLLPERDDQPSKPTRAELRRMPPVERRRAKIEYAAQSGRFRTWVYVVVLVVMVGGFALYLSLV